MLDAGDEGGEFVLNSSAVLTKQDASKRIEAASDFRLFQSLIHKFKQDDRINLALCFSLNHGHALT